MKTVAVLQSNYIPWKGYFDIINEVDVFVFYDEVQYTNRDWRNRNKIYLQNELKWLTVPCGNNRNMKIFDVKISKEVDWQQNHINTIRHCYSRAPYYKKYKDFFEYVYCERKWDYLYELDRYLIENISRQFLGIKTEFVDSRDFESTGNKHEKLLNLVKATGTDIYVSGPTAKDYIIEDEYINSNIKIIWKDYSGYPQYKQMYETFENNVSIIDTLFNTGDDAPYYIWGWRK